MTAGIGPAVAKLAARFGADSVLTAAADVEPYRADGSYRAGHGDVVVFRPATAADLAAGLMALREAPVDLVPRGGGSGLAGGAVPRAGRAAVVVSSERMRRVLSLDPMARVLVAEAGVTLAAAQAAAAGAGLHLGLDHGGAGSAALGGSVATNAGGSNVLRYGMARDQILGVEAVLADGRSIGAARVLWKSNAGYSLAQLLAGSEGTLAFVTAVALKLRAAPVARKAALFALPGPGAALPLLALARAELGEAVCAAELMCPFSTAFAADQGHARPVPEIAGRWAMLLEAESTSPHFDLDAAFDACLAAAFETGHAVGGVVAGSEAQRAAFWSLREGIATAMGAWRGPIGKTDTAVPVGAVPDFIAAVQAGAQTRAPGARAAFFGHAGDGNIHVNFLPADADSAALPDLLRLVEDAALALGGTVSAEHGIGSSKRAALARMLSGAELELMAGIRGVFDPSGRLNPGKIFPSPANSGDSHV